MKTDRGYGVIMRAIMRDSTLSIGAKVLYSYLCGFAGKTGECYPTRKLMCDELGICEQTLSRYIRELTGRGIINRNQVKGNGKYLNNIYKVDKKYLYIPG